MRRWLAHSPFPSVFLTGVLLGSTLVVTRFSLGQFETQTYVALRLAGGALAFLIGYLIFRLRPWPRDPGLWLRAGIYGLIGTALTMTGFTQSLRYQSSGVTSLLTTLSPVETALLAHFFLKGESLTRQRLFGGVLAFAGAGLLLLRGESGLADLAQADWRGYAWALMGITSNSIGLVYARRWLRTEDPFVVTSIRIITGALAIGLLTALTVGYDLGAVRPSGLLAVLYAAIAGTFMAFLFYLTIVQRFSATIASQTEYVVPLIATGLGVIFLGEQVTLTMLAGMLIIFAGLAIFDRAGRKPA
jgi:drug/metabolite transporter (DMT)-like permease